eukprot:2321999-Rhodomonas_salina.1
MQRRASIGRNELGKAVGRSGWEGVWVGSKGVFLCSRGLRSERGSSMQRTWPVQRAWVLLLSRRLVTCPDLRQETQMHIASSHMFCILPIAGPGMVETRG